MNEAKVIRFNGRDLHCVGMWPQPWREPELNGGAAWIQNRHPEINFTPVRWRFVCLEGVIAVVPIGFFDDRGPDHIPVEIRAKTGWQEWASDSAEQEDYMKGTSIRRPPKTTVVELELLNVWNSIITRCPVLSFREAQSLTDVYRYEAVYDDGRQPDYFVSVCRSLLDPMENEVEMIARHLDGSREPDDTPKTQRRRKRGIYCSDGRPILTEEFAGYQEVFYNGKTFGLPPKAGAIVHYFVELFNGQNRTCASTREVMDACKHGESILQGFKNYEAEYRLLIRRKPKTRNRYEFLPALDAVASSKVSRSSGKNSL